jgi:stringent starvation protein B
VEPKNKQQAVEEMLSKGDTMVCLDSRYPGVQVPENHKGREDLRLVLNLNFRHDITTLPDGIQAELLFGGAPFLCWIPYESLWAVYNPQTGEGYLWPGQTPLGLRDLLAEGPEAEGNKSAQGPTAPAESPADREEKGRPRFRVIEGGKKD